MSSRDLDATGEYTDSLEMHADNAERRVGELLSDVVHIQSHRNSVLPINTLPDEVLCGIFLAVATRGGLPSLLATTHTCFRFRSVALTYPFCWTFVTIPQEGIHPDLMDTVILRTRAAQVSLRVTFPPYELPSGRLWSNLCKCEVFFPRLVYLNVTFDLTTTLRPISTIWMRDLPAPVLRTLILHRPSSAIHPCILPPLFQGICPNLHTLQTEGCQLPWTRENYRSSLKELRIRGTEHYVPTGWLHANSLVDCNLANALQDCTELHTLSLEDCDVPNLRPPPITFPVTGPNLRRLILRLSFFWCGYVLSMLNTEQDLEISIQIIGNLENTWSHADSTRQAVLLKILKCITRAQNLMICGGGLYALVGSKSWPVSIEFIPSATFPVDFASLLSQSPLLDLHSISVEDAFNMTFNPQHLVHLLEAAPNITALAISGCKRSEPVWDELARAGQSKTFCSNLRSISILDCYVDQPAFEQLFTTWSTTSTLEHLSVERCRFSAPWYDLKCRLASNLAGVWRGCTTYPSLPSQVLSRSDTPMDSYRRS